MPVSGLVVTLSSDAVLADQARSWLRRRPEVELGERQGRRLPLVAETSSALDAHNLHDAIRALPGVVGVDVTFVAYDDEMKSSGDWADALPDPRSVACVPRGSSNAAEVEP